MIEVEVVVVAIVAVASVLVSLIWRMPAENLRRAPGKLDQYEERVAALREQLKLAEKRIQSLELKVASRNLRGR